MARKRKAPPTPATQQPESQKPKSKPNQLVESSSEEEEESYEEVEVEEEEEEVEEEEEEEEEEDDDDDDEEEEEEQQQDDEEEQEQEETEQPESDSEDDESKRTTLRKLLEPFGKDQIVEFLKEAASKNPSVLTRITVSAESDPIHRKLFVHGLGWDATSDQVISAFKTHGEVEECKLVTDKSTGRAKGYAFVLFKTRRGALNALENPQKRIGNRTTSCQLASAGPVLPKTHAGPTSNPMAVGQSHRLGGVGLVNNSGGAAADPVSIGANNPGFGMGGGHVNSVIGSYGSQAGFQGLGPYQFGGHSSSVGPGVAAGASIPDQTGFGPLGTGFPSYFGR